MMRSDFMARAIELAKKGQYSASPNPMVGCVIVQNNQIIAEGWHQAAGYEHAETVALNKSKVNVKGATLYVTLEPCCHYGKTPPCVDSIIRTGIKHVVIGSFDPNPLVCGKGIDALQKANIMVTVGVLEEQCRQLNRYFFSCYSL